MKSWRRKRKTESLAYSLQSGKYYAPQKTLLLLLLDAVWRARNRVSERRQRRRRAASRKRESRAENAQRPDLRSDTALAAPVNRGDAGTGIEIPLVQCAYLVYEREDGVRNGSILSFGIIKSTVPAHFIDPITVHAKTLLIDGAFNGWDRHENVTSPSRTIGRVSREN
ncbi:hypothetical protein QAD02_003772 [Eretmocerus hayati]|uniref:Uncharacterized protein n=1 Tax=Eretmocerus hayati TaxID=131215 RepID=A0ACC2NNW2_9HYME|nr:hypothetical protein QAD02_003772 [Eretmocerus hayati]